MNYQEWFHRWAGYLPPQAQQEFAEVSRPDMFVQSDPGAGVDEAGVQTKIQRVAQKEFGTPLWRNNSGAVTDAEDGRHIRFGLANVSARLNKKFKSPDLIGPRPVLIMPHHVGRKFALFAAVEAKPPGWHQTPSDKRAEAQARFMSAVHNLGGLAGFAQSEDDARRILHVE